jgi:integral membrane protein
MKENLSFVPMKSRKTFSRFRKIAMAEGISFIVLLFIAMPLKYLADMPMAVTIVGGIHGFLFILYIIYMYLVHDAYQKNWRWMAKAFIASILPFGTFVMDKEWKREEALAGTS